MTEIQVSSSKLSLEYMIELLETIRVYKEDRESENQLWNKAAMSCLYKAEWRIYVIESMTKS